MAEEDFQEDQDETELANRQEFAQEEEERFAEEKTPLPEAKESVSSLATLRDRLAALFIDGLVFYFLYIVTLLLYRMIVWKSPFGSVPLDSPHVYIFHGIIFTEIFLYYFIGEAVFFTTIGKFCNWMSVRSVHGGIPSILSVILRNLFRPVDLLLGVFPTWVLLEKTQYRQRLGDMIAGTIVIRRFSWSGQHIPVEGNIASASLRVCAGMMDLVFAVGFLGGLALLLDPQRPLFSILLFAAFPFAVLFWFLSWQVLTQTSPGKWIFGLRYVLEDGRPLTFSSALFRTLLLPVDLTPVGWLSLFLSERNQRVGDLVGGSLVIHAKRSWHGWVGTILGLLLAGLFWFLGQANPRNFTTPFFNTKFLQFMLPVEGAPAESQEERSLMITQFKYRNTDGTFRPSSQFAAGEAVLFSFEVVGFTVRDGRAWLEEDLEIRYPNGEVGFKQEGIINFNKPVKSQWAPLELNNTLNLPDTTAPGHYRVLLMIRDKLSNRKLTHERFFDVVAPLQ